MTDEEQRGYPDSGGEPYAYHVSTIDRFMRRMREVLGRILPGRRDPTD